MLTFIRPLPLAFIAFAPVDVARAGGSGAVAEIVTFRLAPGTAEAAFLDAARALDPVLRAAPGFSSRRLSCGDDGNWTDHVEWRSLHDATTAAADIMTRPEAAPFMSAIDPATIAMRHEAMRLALPD